MIKLPEDVKKIISILGRAGFEAYAVGGCVRDSLLGREPYDWDITTSALPEQVKSVFKRTIDTGIKHGTVTVRMNGKSYEVTTYRVDGKYSDGRHPDEVRFSPSLFEDLKRRDFTINAMAYNDASGVIDLFGAQRDLEKGIVRCVGVPRERFFEDSLRMLRAVRFAALLSFNIEEKTFAAIRTLAYGLSRVSEERIAAELMKIILSDHPDYLRKAYEAGLTKIFFPEFDRMMQTIQNTPHHMYTVGEHTLRVMMNVRPERVLRLSALLHDVAKPVTRRVDEHGRDHFTGHPEIGAEMTVDILKRLKFDNATIEDTARLVRFHDERPEITKKNMPNVLFKDAMDRAHDDVSKGTPLTKPIQDCGLFPPMICHMVKIGEETGNIEEMLDKSAVYYEEEVEIAIQGMLAAMEPMIIILLAAIVGVLLAACLRPMMTMYDALDNL